VKISYQAFELIPALLLLQREWEICAFSEVPFFSREEFSQKDKFVKDEFFLKLIIFTQALYSYQL
jgi:hypothetical protein